MPKERKWLISLYGSKRRLVRNFVLKIVIKIEKGEYHSKTLRAIFKKYYQVDVGLYSHGGCFSHGNYGFGRNTTIGRYCSIAHTARGMSRNHPMENCSTHALFFNPKLGLVNEDNIEFIPLDIGSDVWIGHNAIIMPSVTKIEVGAVIAAGAVVNKNVPPYAIMVGNPARIVRYRFPPEVIGQLIKSKWWEKPLEELDIQQMSLPMNNYK